MDDPFLKVEPYELTLNLVLTSNCNFRCEHCGYDCPRPHTQRLTKAQIGGAIAQANDIGFRSVHLVGGEPTLSMDLVEHAIETAGRYCMATSMISNGSFLRSRAKTHRLLRLIETYETTVSISCDEFHRKFWDSGMERMLNAYTLEETFREYRVRADGKECAWVGSGDGSISFNLRHVDVDPSNICPSGRGYNVGFFTPSKTDCLGPHLTIGWNGEIWDTCCRFGRLRLGRWNSDFVTALILAQDYINTMSPNCYECNDMVREYHTRYIGRRRPKAQALANKIREERGWRLIQEPK